MLKYWTCQLNASTAPWYFKIQKGLKYIEYLSQIQSVHYTILNSVSFLICRVIRTLKVVIHFFNAPRVFFVLSFNGIIHPYLIKIIYQCKNNILTHLALYIEKILVRVVIMDTWRSSVSENSYSLCISYIVIKLISS